jgi:hypothetical protein
MLVGVLLVVGLEFRVEHTTLELDMFLGTALRLGVERQHLEAPVVVVVLGWEVGQEDTRAAQRLQE